jgi:isoleucyl-tRNA synthetase
VNVKELVYLTDTEGILVKKIRPNFKTLGPKFGKLMKQIAAAIATFTQEEIADIERNGSFALSLEEISVELTREDVEILSEDIPGWQVASEGRITVALDTTITASLRQEGIARELINRIQNLRKENNLEVTDKIELWIQKHDQISDAIVNNYEYICSETLATNLHYTDAITCNSCVEMEIDEDVKTFVSIRKLNN